MQKEAKFLCPICGAKYHVAHIEALNEPTQPITCIAYDGPLSGREGAFFLKYFLIERPKSAPAAQLIAS